MGLTKFFEERKKHAEAEKIYRRDQNLAYQQGLQRGRMAGAYSEGMKRGKQQAKQPSGGLLGNLGRGAVAVMQDIGGHYDAKAANSMFGDFGNFGDFGFGPQRRSSKPKAKKRKGKRITVYVK